MLKPLSAVAIALVLGAAAWWTSPSFVEAASPACKRWQVRGLDLQLRGGTSLQFMTAMDVPDGWEPIGYGMFGSGGVLLRRCVD